MYKKCSKPPTRWTPPFFFGFAERFHQDISRFHQGADQGDALHEEDAADPSFDAFPDGAQLGQAQHAHEPGGWNVQRDLAWDVGRS